ncbi:unnamed protein product [Orchesella dallaii]|uniref:Uncharacterized protein n=1 Tax=Orchesella dallaii TaxID=48710 RepID=A0ABP1RQU9_9HEXA
MNDVSFYEVDYIIAASTEAINEGMRQFKESFSQEGEEGRAEIRRMLNEKTSSIVNNLLERNTLNQQRAERQITKHMEDSIENYKTFMQQLTTGITIDGLALGNMHNHLRKKAVDNFNASVFPGTRAFQQKFLCDLETSIDTLFKAFLTGEQTKMEEQQLESNTLLKTARQEYEKEFSEFAEMSMSRNEMEDLHSQISSNILDKFKAKNPYPQGGANYLNFKTALLQELDSAKQNFMLNHVEKKRKIESYPKAQEQSINTYITEMDRTMRAGCMPEAELNKLHEDVHSLALNTFDEMTQNSSDAIQQRMEFENRITEMFSNLKISNNQSLKAKTETAETILNDAQQQYINVMENGIYKSRKQFEGAHQQYLENYEKMLTETLKGDDELKQSLLNKFGNFVSQKYNALVGNIEVKIKQERLTLFKLLQDVQTMYHDEMAKQSKGRTFSSINALEHLHRKISIKAITQCSRLSKITPTPEQRQRLVLAMEDSFCKYKLEYTINKSNQTDNPAIGIDL